jgi:hypothetical protein
MQLQKLKTGVIPVYGLQENKKSKRDKVRRLRTKKL